MAISCDHGVHNSEVTKVEYFSDNNTVVSCSSDPVTTLIVRHMMGRRKPYVFTVRRVSTGRVNMILRVGVPGHGVVHQWRTK